MDAGRDGGQPGARDGSQPAQPEADRDAARRDGAPEASAARESVAPDASQASDAGAVHDAGDGAVGFVAASCEDDAMSDASAPSAGPKASISFPPRASYTAAEWLTVRGAASDPDGVSAVHVNGMQASTSNGFASWSARVPIADGCTRLRVTTTDQLGNRNENATSASVRNQGPPLSTISALELDAQHERLIVVSWRVDAILSVSLRDGRVRVLSPREGAVGPFLGSEALAIDAAHNRLIVAPRDDDMLLALELESGERRMLVASSQVQGLDIQFASALALDGDTVYVLKHTPSSVVAIDLSTGARRLVMADASGALDLLVDAVSDPTAPRLLVSQPQNGTILAINLRTYGRSVWAGAQQALVHPGRMRLDAAGRRLLVVDGEGSPAAISEDRTTRNELVAIDLSSGARTRVAGPGTGREPLLSQAFALAFDARTRHAYIAGETDGQIVRVDVVSGARSLLVHSNVGTGKRFLLANSPVLARGELWLTDEPRNALLRVDLSNGDRSDLSSEQVGSGPFFNGPSALALGGYEREPEPRARTRQSRHIVDRRGSQHGQP